MMQSMLARSTRRSLLSAALAASALVPSARLFAQTAGSPYHLAEHSEYQRLDVMKSGRAAAPIQLAKRVSLRRDDILLQQALMEIATQAGMGLSYGEELSAARVSVKVNVRNVTAAEAFATAIRGTGWMLYVSPSGQAVVLRDGAGRRAVGTVVGRVTDAATGQGIATVVVSVEGTQLGATTGADGSFRIGNVPTGLQTLTARRLGYVPASVQVTVADDQAVTADITLNASPIALDQIVVTGQPVDTRKRAIGNSVAAIDASDVVATSPVNNVQDLINGRAPGVVVMLGTGQVGSGSRIRVRGASISSLSADPLIYVDGVRVDNTTGSGMEVQSFGSGIVSRLNDFNPEDIEKIEILRGPSAATLYGTEASRGVVNIITKKGQVGAPSYSVVVKQGAHWLDNPQGRMPLNYWKDPDGVVRSLNIVQRQNDLGNPIFRTGHSQEYSASIRGGSPTVRYFISADGGNTDGAERDNFQRTFSGRVNVDVMPTEKIDLSANTGFTRSKTGLSSEGGSAGVTWATLYSTPAFLPEYRCAADPSYGCDFWQGFRNGPPERTYTLTSRQNVDRFTGNLQLTYRPLSWLTNRLIAGVDIAQEQNLQYRPYITNDTLQYFLGPTASLGFRFNARWQRVLATFDYSGTAQFDITPSINSATSIGVQYYQRHRESLRAQGNDYAGPGLTTIGATARKTLSDDSYLDNNTLGTFAQQTFAWRDRLFLTGALRVDNNSAFGEDIKWVTYPKASLSWVVSEEPALQRIVPSFLNPLKLRVAYGQSGQQPAAFAALRTYNPISGPGGTPAVTPGNRGNPDLRPERSSEIEAGFDAAVLDGRVGLEFTYYHTRVRDVILLAKDAPSYGFANSTYINAGQMLNQGIEASLRAQIIEGKSFGWKMGLTLASNSGKVEKLNSGDTTITFSFLESLEHRLGYTPSAWFSQRVVSARYDAVTGKATDVLCDDGRGGSTPCYDADGNVVAPRVYFGRALPSLEGSLSTGVTLLGGLEISAMVDFKTGFQRFDNTYRIRCQLNTTCLENMYPEQYPELTAQFQSNDKLVGYAIRDAGFAKLREISLRYALPRNLIAKAGVEGASLTVAARNLHTWTKWKGMDPETMFLEGSRPYVEQNNLPQLMQFVTTLRVNF